MSFYGSVTSEVSTKQFPANPISGPFGTGLARFFPASGNFTVPAGITALRVRVWGAGADGSASRPGAGGGFAFKQTIGVTPGQVVAVVVGVGNGGALTGESSVLGVVATGGLSTGVPGAGSGGDVNTTGGATNSGGQSGGGGGVASLIGNGGSNNTVALRNSPRGSGAGGGGATGNSGYQAPQVGFDGSFGAMSTTSTLTGFQTQQGPGFLVPLDYIGTGGGGFSARSYTCGAGMNGGGGGSSIDAALQAGDGGFPGGGGGRAAATYEGYGAAGLVIIEY